MAEQSNPGAGSGGKGTTQPQKPAKWGIYVYFAADVRDPDMQAAVWSTLQTLASVGSTDDIKITAMIDLPDRNTEYYIIPQKPRDPSITRWRILPDRFLSRNVNSASIGAIVDFFGWSTRNCPADKIALVFWGHGYALDDFDPRIQANGGSAGQNRPRRSKQRIAHSFPGKSGGGELKLLYDVTHDTVLSNRAFAQAIREFTEKFNARKPIQVLGLDCCNMAMAEVLCELQGVAEYAVAAETGLPFQAWLSAPVLKTFLGKPHVSAEEFAKGAIKDFVNSFSHSANRYIELSACNLKNFGALEGAVNQLVTALLPAIEKYENRRAIARAWFHDVSFVPDGLIDLSSFCRLLVQYIDSNERALAEACAKVRDAVSDVVELAKFAPDSGGRRLSLSTGLSIWFPPWIQRPEVRYAQIEQSKNYLRSGYSSTHFAKVTGWDSFLRKLYQLTQA